MRTLGRDGFAALVLVASLLGCDRPRAGPPMPVPELRSVLPGATPTPLPAGRAVSAGEPGQVAAAVGFLEAPVITEACGPYTLVTDARGPRIGSLRRICAGPVAGLDAEYRQRLGVPLHHPARGTLVAFADRRRFRAWAAADGRLPQGYAGLSLAASGLVALPVGDIPEAEVARTLTHELAHLAHRRAFGVELAPWLSEGLAGAFGDSARGEGFTPLSGFAGVEGLRVRLLGGYGTSRAGSLERLVGLDRDRFDRGAVSYDYEQSALFVRFLLLDSALAPRFRSWLVARAWRGAEPTAALPAALAADWVELERRFRTWLGG